MAETWIPVPPSGRCGTSPTTFPCSLFSTVFLLQIFRAAVVVTLPLGTLSDLRKRMPCILGCLYHLLHLHLLHIDWKFVCQPRLGIVELQRHFVEFKAPVGGLRLQNYETVNRIHSAASAPNRRESRCLTSSDECPGASTCCI